MLLPLNHNRALGIGPPKRARLCKLPSAFPLPADLANRVAQCDRADKDLIARSNLMRIEQALGLGASSVEALSERTVDEMLDVLSFCSFNTRGMTPERRVAARRMFTAVAQKDDVHEEVVRALAAVLQQRGIL